MTFWNYCMLGNDPVILINVSFVISTVSPLFLIQLSTYTDSNVQVFACPKRQNYGYQRYKSYNLYDIQYSIYCMTPIYYKTVCDATNFASKCFSWANLRTKLFISCQCIRHKHGSKISIC